MPRKTKQNDITSPELLKQVNPQNLELLRDFLSYLRSIQRSETTIAGYENDIQIAWVWCLQHNDNKFFVDWTKRNIVAYQNWMLNQNGNSPARIRRLKASLSSLSNYIEAVLDDEFPNFRNIINKVENPINRPVRAKTVWDDAEVEALLARLNEKGDHEKACALALGLYSGRRKAELCRFRVSDFDESNLVCNGALYKSAPIQTKGRGGGKYINCYTLAKRFKPYFDAWMQYRQQHNIESEWLFPSHNNPTEQISATTLNSWAVTFSRMTGEDFYWHSLRHYFTTSLSKAGLPDNIIQEIVGWTSGDMVALYKDISAEDQIAQYFTADGEINTSAVKDISDL